MDGLNNYVFKGRVTVSSVVRIFVSLILCGAFSVALANGNKAATASPEPRDLTLEPLIFQDWKNQQIQEAQQALEKVAGDNNSQALAQKTAQTLVATELPSSQRIQVSGKRARHIKQKRDVRSAYEGLQYAHDLGLEEYISVYLVNYRENVQALTSLMERLSTQESARLMQALMKEKERRAALERTGTTSLSGHLRGIGGLNR